jgi:hypothetical protein
MEATIKSTNYPRPKKASGKSDFNKLAATSGRAQALNWASWKLNK